jgi:2,5-dioxopentanoate dehydrogenase
MISGKNQVGSQLTANGAKTYKTFDPILNQENPWVFTEASNEEISKATALANKAFPIYQNFSAIERSAFLNTIADEILHLGEALIDVYCMESGLTRGRAEIERGRTIFQLRSFADAILHGQYLEATIDTAQPERLPNPRIDIRKMMIPIGPIVVFGSSNFPFAYSTAGGDTASALAAGCPVIVKSHPMHAGTSEMVAKAVTEAAQKTGMPEGVFSNLNSSGIEVGIQLVNDPLVKAIGFTGSIKGGRAIYDAAAKRPEPIPVFAEMGSVNPVVLLPKALNNESGKWANAISGSITLGTGQFCTNPGLVFGIESDALSEFSDQLASEILKVVPSSMLHPTIHKNYTHNKEKLKGQSHVEVIAENGDTLQANYANQTVLKISSKTFLENKTLHQEVFGPFSMLVTCKDNLELERCLGSMEGQLTGTIIGEVDELEKHKNLIEILRNRVGRIVFNGVPTGVEVCNAMLHGGPYPASTDSRFTAVGVHAIKRWLRPISYQNWPNALLPDALKNENPLKILRLVNSQTTLSPII